MIYHVIKIIHLSTTETMAIHSFHWHAWLQCLHSTMYSSNTKSIPNTKAFKIKHSKSCRQIMKRWAELGKDEMFPYVHLPPAQTSSEKWLCSWSACYCIQKYHEVLSLWFNCANKKFDCSSSFPCCVQPVFETEARCAIVEVDNSIHMNLGMRMVWVKIKYVQFLKKSASHIIVHRYSIYQGIVSRGISS